MKMGFQQVYNQYLEAVSGQLKRRNRQRRDFFTKDEQKALLFYGEAVQRIHAMEEPAREGEKIFSEDLHAENPDMRGQVVEELPVNSGDPVGGTQA